MSRWTEPAGLRSVKLLVAAAVVAGGALLGWGHLAGRNEAAIETQRERAIKVPIRVAGNSGDPVITLDAETQLRSGVETAALPSTPHPEELRAYGMVLDVARLTELSNNYANAKAQVQIVQAKLAMSKPAFDRAQKLFNETHVVSQAQLQAAEAAFGTDQASLVAGEAQVRDLGGGRRPVALPGASRAVPVPAGYPWCRIASAASWAREVMWSLANTCARWVCTVRRETYSRWPICGFDLSLIHI